MKKIITISTLTILCSVLSAQVFTSINAQYDCAYKIKSETGSPNWGSQLIYRLSVYWFPDNSSFGVFSYVGGKILPQSYGLLAEKKVTDYFVDFNPCIGIGAGFRYPITQKIMLKTGIAASIDFQIFQSEHKSGSYEMKQNDFIITLGIINDVGCTYMLTKDIYVGFGTALGLWYANYTYRKNIYSYMPNAITNEWDKKYFKISVAPFIGLGLKLPL